MPKLLIIIANIICVSNGPAINTDLDLLPSSENAGVCEIVEKYQKNHFGVFLSEHRTVFL